MIRVLVIFTGVWGFVVLPALCPAGILSDCCEDARSDSPDQECGCDACAAVCGTLCVGPEARACDQLQSESPHAQPVDLYLPADAESLPLYVTSLATGNLDHDLNLPFPISDRPLLI